LPQCTRTISIKLKKSRTKAGLHEFIEWLTSFDKKELDKLIVENERFKTFFVKASLHPNTILIQAAICNYRLQQIVTPPNMGVRFLDKLVDELAQGRNIKKILRTYIVFYCGIVKLPYMASV